MLASQFAGRIAGGLQRVESIAAMLAYVAVAGLLISDIVAREVFSASIHGAQKIAVYGAVIAAFLGLSLATGSNAHLRPAFLDSVMPARFHNAINRFSDAFACVFFLTFAVIAVLFVRESMNFNDRAAVLYWLLWPIQIVIPWAFFSTAVRHGLFALYPQIRPQPQGAH